MNKGRDLKIDTSTFYFYLVWFHFMSIHCHGIGRSPSNEWAISFSLIDHLFHSRTACCLLFFIYFILSLTLHYYASQYATPCRVLLIWLELSLIWKLAFRNQISSVKTMKQINVKPYWKVVSKRPYVRPPCTQNMIWILFISKKENYFWNRFFNFEDNLFSA